MDCGDNIFLDECWPGIQRKCVGRRTLLHPMRLTEGDTDWQADPGGMLLCRECRNKFTCRMGTSMEHSHVPLHKWLQALLNVTTGDRRLSPQRLKADLDLGSYRTAG